MKQVQLQVGSSCYWRGKQYEIIGSDVSCGKRFWLLWRKTDIGSDGYSVSVSEVQPLASDVFEIGESVRSKRTFRGKVVGFEQITNRVLCVAHHIDANEDRSRWAYRVDEIEQDDLKFNFELNKTYHIKYDPSCYAIQVRAMEHPGCSSEVLLYRIDNGKLFKSVPKECPASILAEQGLKVV